MNIEEIQSHLEQTSFNPKNDHPIKLWAYNGEGLFSDGQEGFALTPDQELECDPEDLEFLAKAPEYIEFLLKQLQADS